MLSFLDLATLTFTIWSMHLFIETLSAVSAYKILNHKLETSQSWVMKSPSRSIFIIYLEFDCMMIKLMNFLVCVKIWNIAMEREGGRDGKRRMGFMICDWHQLWCWLMFHSFELLLSFFLMLLSQNCNVVLSWNPHLAGLSYEHAYSSSSWPNLAI